MLATDKAEFLYHSQPFPNSFAPKPFLLRPAPYRPWGMVEKCLGLVDPLGDYNFFGLADGVRMSTRKTEMFAI